MVTSNWAERGLSVCSVFCVLVLSVTPARAAWRYQPPALGPEVVATNGVLTSVPPYHISYSEDGSRPMCTVVRGHRYRLFYPKTFESQRSLDEVRQTLDRGFARVEAKLGATIGPTDIYVAQSITPRSNPCDNNVFMAGIAFRNTRNVVVFAAAFFSEALVAHELMHIRFREMGFRPLSWFEEGMAEYIGEPNGFSARHFEHLRDHGTLSVEQMGSLKPCTMKDQQARATAWALVYYLVHVEGHDFARLPMLSEHGDPGYAYEAVREMRAKSAQLVDTE